MKTNILVAFLFLLMLSCKMIATAKYHVNRKFKFTSRHEYADYLKKKNFLSEDHILYLDSSSYMNFFMERIMADNSIIYQGTYTSDSTLIKRSNFLEDNKSCKGRIQDEVENNIKMQAIPDSIIIKSKRLSSYKLYSLSSNEPFVFNKNNKRLNIFLGYIYKAGTYYDDFYYDIKKIQEKYASEVEVYLITLDRLDYLK